MSKDTLIHIIDSTKVKDSVFSKASDTLVTMQDLKVEIISNSDKIIDANSSLGLPEWISIIVTGIFGVLTVWFYFQQKKQSDSINTQVNILRDINRPFKDRFPEIINHIKSMCDEAIKNPKETEFFIMNRTSAFGKIHTFNKKFYTHYNIENPKNGSITTKILKETFEDEKIILKDISKNEDKWKYLFYEDVRTLNEKIIACSKELDDDKFKLIVFKGEEGDKLDTTFIAHYFDEVNQLEKDVKKGNGLVHFKFKPAPHKGTATIDCVECSNETEKENVEKLIREEVIKMHNELIDNIKTNGKLGTTDVQEWLKYDESIPMQMYLLKRKVNNKFEYNTFIINAMSSIDDGDKDRYIDGLHSTERSIYSVFRTLFDQTFKQA